MTHNSGKSFTTFDRDNDGSPTINCAEFRKGAWWHDICLDANLNGFYHIENPLIQMDGISWVPWKDNWHSLKSTLMKIKRV